MVFYVHKNNDNLISDLIIKSNTGQHSQLIFYCEQVVIINRNSMYGSYIDGPGYNSAVDYNPRYGEDVTTWEGGVVTDKNHEYQMVSK